MWEWRVVAVLRTSVKSDGRTSIPPSNLARWVRSRGLEFRMKVHTLEDRARDENRSPDDPEFTLDRTGSELGNK